MAASRILVVAPAGPARDLLVTRMEAAGWSPWAADGVEAARRGIAEGPDLLLADRRALPGRSAEELLRTAAATDPDLPCVLLGAARGQEEIDHLLAGAFHVLPGDPDPRGLAAHVARALRYRRLALEARGLRDRAVEESRLAMVGRLTAGLAHELNNPLDGARRFVRLARDAMPEAAPERGYLDEALSGLDRMAAIVQEFLELSRREAPSAGHEDGERMAREAVAQALTGVPPGRHDVFLEFPPDGLILPRSLFGVLGNLVKNAVDAMPGGGALEITARSGHRGIRMTVADTGTGVLPELRDRIFEPFFTTKDPGRGTGLGLAICRRIVEGQDGTLTLDSTPGCGTTVTVRLPPPTAGADGGAGAP